MRESDLQAQVALYLRLQYPGVVFHSDFGSGLKLTKGQAMKQFRQQGGRRGFPDLVIYKARKGFHGLAIELKREGVKLKKRDGSWATSHIREQAVTLEKLAAEGYKAMFAVGYKQAKTAIDEYLMGGDD